MKTVISAENIFKSLSSRPILKNISFHMEAGEFYALLGPNGAGKTTLMSLLSGLRRPDEGKMEIFGRPPQSQEVRQLRGITPQELDFPAQLEVKELLTMLAGLYQNPRAIDELAELFRLKSFWRQKAGGLSGGQKRLVGLAIAFLGNPQFVILDEPTTGLDLEAKESLWNFLTAEKKRGTSVLITSHDLNEIEMLAEKVILLHRGEILYQGPMSEILARVQKQRIEFESDWSEVHFAGYPVQHLHRRRTILSSDSDRVVRELIQSEVSFSRLRVEAAGLEEALREMNSSSGRNQ